MQERVQQLQAELSRLTDERSGIQIDQRTLLDARQTAQSELQIARQRVQEQRRREATAALESKKFALSAGNSAVAGIQQRLAIARERIERAKPYVDTAVTRFQFLQWNDDALALERELDVQRQTNARLKHEIDEAQERLLLVSSERASEIAMEIADKRTRLTESSAELGKLKKMMDEATIMAPIDGTIQRAISSRPGSAVTFGESLFEIVPADAPLVIEIEVPNAEMGFLRVGQSVDVKLDAFPFQNYGRLAGTLTWLSPDAERLDIARSPKMAATSTQTTSSAASVYVYRGKVNSQPHPLLKLSPGLTAQIDIKTDQRRVIDFFLFPAQKALEEGLSVR